MPAKEQRLYDWYWNNKYQSEKHGSGVREAFRAGARAAIRGRKEDPYSRSDCYDAYNAGYFAMKETLETTIIICDCCESKIDKRKSP
jgi:hypothetical protein